MATELMVKQNQISLSLQNIFTEIINRIAENERNVLTNKSRLNSISALIIQLTSELNAVQKKIDDEFNRVEMSLTNIRFKGGRGPVTQHFVDNGRLGQLGKLDPYNRWIFPHDECIRCLAYTSSEEMYRILEEPWLEEKCIYNKIDPAIYDIQNNKRTDISHNYDSSRMEERASYIREYIPHRTWLVNPVTKKVYFYFFPGRWIDFSKRSDDNTGKILVDGQYKEFETEW